ncbi:MAG: hypothetical protein JXA33_05140 [Anaerolineae bacterium]|nr:hypothetical protein [Anaerolineae bacterium]
MTITFEQIVDTVREFPIEQQEMLADLLRSWHIQNRRLEIAQDAQESLAAFREGHFKPQSAQEVITELLQEAQDDQA